MVTVRASQLERILNCSHSLNLPTHESKSKYALDGINQHTLAFNNLTKNELNININENTQCYIDYVNNYKNDYKIYFETSLKYEVNENITLKGTPDAVIYSIDKNLIEIVDLKNGYQEVLPSSIQLIAYGILVNKVSDFKFTIIQNEDIKSISITKDTFLELKDKLINKLISSIEKTTFETGDHCRFCPSKIHCKKLYDSLKLDENNLQTYYDLVKNKSYIGNMIEDAESFLLKNKRDWFKESVRKMKKWKEGAIIPSSLKPLTPAAALRIDKKYEDLIEIEEKITYKLK